MALGNLPEKVFNNIFKYVKAKQLGLEDSKHVPNIALNEKFHTLNHEDSIQNGLKKVLKKQRSVHRRKVRDLLNPRNQPALYNNVPIAEQIAPQGTMKIPASSDKTTTEEAQKHFGNIVDAIHRNGDIQGENKGKAVKEMVRTLAFRRAQRRVTELKLSGTKAENKAVIEKEIKAFRDEMKSFFDGANKEIQRGQHKVRARYYQPVLDYHKQLLERGLEIANNEGQQLNQLKSQAARLTQNAEQLKELHDNIDGNEDNFIDQEIGSTLKKLKKIVPKALQEETAYEELEQLQVLKLQLEDLKKLEPVRSKLKIDKQTYEHQVRELTSAIAQKEAAIKLLKPDPEKRKDIEGAFKNAEVKGLLQNLARNKRLNDHISDTSNLKQNIGTDVNDYEQDITVANKDLQKVNNPDPETYQQQKQQLKNVIEQHKDLTKPTSDVQRDVQHILGILPEQKLPQLNKDELEQEHGPVLGARDIHESIEKINNALSELQRLNQALTLGNEDTQMAALAACEKAEKDIREGLKKLAETFEKLPEGESIICSRPEIEDITKKAQKLNEEFANKEFFRKKLLESHLASAGKKIGNFTKMIKRDKSGQIEKRTQEKENSSELHAVEFILVNNPYAEFPEYEARVIKDLEGNPLKTNKAEIDRAKDIANNPERYLKEFKDGYEKYMKYKKDPTKYPDYAKYKKYEKRKPLIDFLEKNKHQFKHPPVTSEKIKGGVRVSCGTKEGKNFFIDILKHEHAYKHDISAEETQKNLSAQTKTKQPPTSNLGVTTQNVIPAPPPGLNVGQNNPQNLQQQRQNQVPQGNAPPVAGNNNINQQLPINNNPQNQNNQQNINNNNN